ncbi:MAG: MFS transporter [Clostridiaceae bacterium]
MENKQNQRPFGLRDKIGYMFGNFGNDFTFTFASIYLMVFYTKVLGIHAGLVGTLFVVSRILDAFTDITMGRIADKKKPTKDGKFRPWIKWMCGPVALASFLMYQCSMANASMTLRIVYMFATYILWGSICYTAINIPYGSMASVLSAEADDRASLSTFRSIGSTITNLVIGVGTPMLIYTTDAAGNQIVQGARFTFVAGLFSVITVICYLICYYSTTERVKVKPHPVTEDTSILHTLKSLVTSRAMLGIVLATIGVLAAQLLNQAINQYLFIDYFKNKSGVAIMSAVSMLPGFILAPLAVPVSKRFGKREVGIFGCLCGAVSCFLLFVLKTSNMWVYIIINVIGFLGFGIYNLIMWAFITDIIDDQEVRTGKREDGTVYGAYSFARKLGQAVAGGLGGWALQFIGFNSAQQVQTQEVLDGIYNIATLIPAILYFLVALSLLLIYPLSKKRVEANIAELKTRHAEN